MIPNLFQATQEYWRKLDELEAAYKQGKITIKEVDERVAELMSELGQERRAAFDFLWHSGRHLLTTETIIGLTILTSVTYAWIVSNSI